MRFSKYHALGNDYVVIDATEHERPIFAEQVIRICDRHRGVGSDGVLFGNSEPSARGFELRIFNPDGSEAEKSGNGLRIFARYLFDSGHVGTRDFDMATPGGTVSARVLPHLEMVRVEMGEVSFDSQAIPVSGPPREVVGESLKVEGNEYEFTAASVGNPHCVVLRDSISAEEAQTVGPVIEKDWRFPRRTNVQFMEIIDRGNIAIEIWERGAGYTLASGSSSCAAAAVARRLGHCGPNISVHMPGGMLEIEIGRDYTCTMTGPASKICEGVLSAELFADLA